jgi:hypothetical protein
LGKLVRQRPCLCSLVLHPLSRRPGCWVSWCVRGLLCSLGLHPLSRRPCCWASWCVRGNASAVWSSTLSVGGHAVGQVGAPVATLLQSGPPPSQSEAMLLGKLVRQRPCLCSLVLHPLSRRPCFWASWCVRGHASAVWSSTVSVRPRPCCWASWCVRGHASAVWSSTLSVGGHAAGLVGASEAMLLQSGPPPSQLEAMLLGKLVRQRPCVCSLVLHPLSRRPCCWASWCVRGHASAVWFSTLSVGGLAVGQVGASEAMPLQSGLPPSQSEAMLLGKLVRQKPCLCSLIFHRLSRRPCCWAS